MEHSLDEKTFEYKTQIEWEYDGLTTANIILFWIPRDLQTLPGFTTNIEWGYWCRRKPSKLVLGFPPNAYKMKYIEYWAKDLKIPIFHNLKETCDFVLTLF